MRYIFIFIVACVIVLCARQASADTLNVHLIPHSHCDPGWLETFEVFIPAIKNCNLERGDFSKIF
jgi:hypothetical protein